MDSAADGSRLAPVGSDAAISEVLIYVVVGWVAYLNYSKLEHLVCMVIHTSAVIRYKT